MLALSIMTALTFASCNTNSDSDYPETTDYVTVIGTSPVSFVTDGGIRYTLAEVDSSIGSYAPNYGERFLIYFTQLKDEQGQKTSYIKLYGYYQILSGDTAVRYTEEEASYGDLDVDLYTVYSEYYLVHPTKKVLDVALCFYAASKLQDHTFTLVVDDENPVDGEYLNATLYHSATATEAAGKVGAYSIISFDMDTFAPYLEGTKGIKINVPGIDVNDPISHEFNWMN